ncbi:hypothetical protein [Streptomyces sp. NPDC005805]|uniref:hypothetical protein n=1 Tax=Streptomyces sp. NPDC005805 TaxID=3157068 RepID=UPI0033F34CAF
MPRQQSGALPAGPVAGRAETGRERSATGAAAAGEKRRREGGPAGAGAAGAGPGRPEGRGPRRPAPERPLWVEEDHGRRRMADPVRRAAVRAVIIVSVTLIQAMAAFLFTVTDSWLAFPTVLTSVAGTVVATWAVLDVWVTRQVWNQRNGVVSVPSSTARQLRRERRRARRAARVAAREAGRIGKSGTGRLSRA